MLRKGSLRIDLQPNRLSSPYQTGTGAPGSPKRTWAEKDGQRPRMPSLKKVTTVSAETERSDHRITHARRQPGSGLGKQPKVIAIEKVVR